MTPREVLKGRVEMSEHAAGVKLLRAQAQVSACAGVRSWRAPVPTSACTSKAGELRRSTKSISATAPVRRSFAVPQCASVMRSLKFCVLFRYLFKSQVQRRCNKGIRCCDRILPPSLVLLISGGGAVKWFLESTGLSQKYSCTGVPLHWQELPAFTALKIAGIFPS